MNRYPTTAGMCLTVLAICLSAGLAGAQNVSLTTAVCAREATALLELDGKLYTGLRYGGLLVRDLDDPGTYSRIVGTDGLSDPQILDLAWTGRSLWVATDGGGLTSITFQDGEPVCRQHSNIDNLTVKKVAGLVQGGNERVYYATEGGGLGQFSDGLPGYTYRTTNSGLLNDVIQAVTTHDQDVYIATNGGVNRLRDNVFSDISAGMTNFLARDLLYVDGVGLVAATLQGVDVYDPVAGTWAPLGTGSPRTEMLAATGQTIWALNSASGSATDRLHRWDGVSWQQVEMETENVNVITGGQALYAAGYRYPSAENLKAVQVFHDLHVDGGWTHWDPVAEMTFFSISGAAFRDDGTIWLSSRSGAGIAGYRDGRCDLYTNVLGAVPDSLAIFNDDARILDLAVTADDEVWFTQFSQKTEISGGLIRFRPDLDDFDHITPDNSAMPSKRGIRLAAHPDGPLFIMSDVDGVVILVDPTRWQDPAQWVNPQLGFALVTDIFFDGPDKAWLAVPSVGVVLWDLNGVGNDAAIRDWTNLADDKVYAPITGITESSFTFSDLSSIAVSADGTVWAGGGSGVINFKAVYGSTMSTEHIVTYKEKLSASTPGLSNAAVNDLVLDQNDDLWIAHEIGLDRIRRGGDEDVIDVFTSLAKYHENSMGALYLPGVIAGMPPAEVYKLTASANGSRIVAGTKFGAVIIDVTATPDAGRPLDSVYLWPNPYLPDEQDGLRIGGTDAQARFENNVPLDGALVEIYNLNGQLVFRSSHVTDDIGFWDGRTLTGTAVATGMYMVRIVFSGQTVIRQLAVVY